MSRTSINFVIDSFLLVITVLLLFTTAVLRFVFPAPTSAAGWLLWGQDYNAWSNFQFIVTVVIGLALLLHIMMHWSWVCGVIITKLLKRSAREAKLDDGAQTLWGVGMLIVVVNILGLLVGAAYLTVQPPAAP